jgi:DNA ligase D-like protein (predicted 3'-phosphoesterase)
MPMSKKPCFVIQKHAATTLHYDFRLEIGGVLKSWAIPKCPSKNPSDKRLAVPTEDHAMEYKDFEGEIPEGLYGAGKVTIWDKGTYENIREKVSMQKAYQEGKIEICLHGKKLTGNYALIRMQRSWQKDKEKPWLIIKMK